MPIFDTGRGESCVLADAMQLPVPSMLFLPPSLLGYPKEGECWKCKATMQHPGDPPYLTYPLERYRQNTRQPSPHYLQTKHRPQTNHSDTHPHTISYTGRRGTRQDPK